MPKKRANNVGHWDLRARRKAYQKGRIAERFAELFLRCKGYQCLVRRYQTPFGEIDLIMRKGQTLIGVEVKARATPDAALESLSRAQQRRIAKALELFQARHPAFTQDTLRFDFVLLAGMRLSHLKSAWSF